MALAAEGEAVDGRAAALLRQLAVEAALPQVVHGDRVVRVASREERAAARRRSTQPAWLTIAKIGCRAARRCPPAARGSGIAKADEAAS